MTLVVPNEGPSDFLHKKGCKDRGDIPQFNKAWNQTRALSTPPCCLLEGPQVEDFMDLSPDLGNCHVCPANGPRSDAGLTVCSQGPLPALFCSTQELQITLILWRTTSKASLWVSSVHPFSPLSDPVFAALSTSPSGDAAFATQHLLQSF